MAVCVHVIWGKLSAVNGFVCIAGEVISLLVQHVLHNAARRMPAGKRKCRR